MRKVLAVASVGVQHKELVLKDLRNIFKRIRISEEVLLQEEIQQNVSHNNSSDRILFKSYPYITLTIPNYEQHRSYLEKAYKNNVLFSKFILLISKGDSYEQLIMNRNQDILREQCRNWNSKVSCEFDSSSVFTEIEQQMSKIDKIFGQMDIRGKITMIDAEKRFHLIEDHLRDDVNNLPLSKDYDVPNQKGLLKLFFGFELTKRNKGDGARAGRIAIAKDLRNTYQSEFMEYEEETSVEPVMKMDDINIWSDKINDDIIQQQILQRDTNGRADLRGKRVIEKRACKRRLDRLNNKNAKNPYLKKKFADEVDLTQNIVSN